MIRVDLGAVKISAEGLHDSRCTRDVEERGKHDDEEKTHMFSTNLQTCKPTLNPTSLQPNSS